MAAALAKSGVPCWAQFPCAASVRGRLRCDQPYASVVQHPRLWSTWAGPLRPPMATVAAATALRPPMATVAAAGVTSVKPLRAGARATQGQLLQGQLGPLPVVIKVMDVGPLADPSAYSSPGHAAYLEAFVAGVATDAMERGEAPSGFSPLIGTVLAVQNSRLQVVAVSRLVQGETLLAYLDRALSAGTPAAVRGAVSCVLQTMAALHVLHSTVGAVHNDAHLGNILVEPRSGQGLRWVVGGVTLVLPPGPTVYLIDYGQCTLGPAAPGATTTPGRDVATVAVMLRMAVPGTKPSWSACLSDHHLASDNALAEAVGAVDRLVRTSLQCSTSTPTPAHPPLPIMVNHCHSAIAKDTKTTCVVRILDYMRSPEAGCNGMSPEAWVSDPGFALFHEPTTRPPCSKCTMRPARSCLP
jgi:hypothetical protein